MNITRQWVKKYWGKKCKEYDDGCIVCRVWHLFESLEQYYDFVMEETETKLIGKVSKNHILNKKKAKKNG